MTEYDKKRYEQYKLAYAAFIALYPFGLEDLQGEIWADIEGYDGDYQESNYGRTKSLKFGKAKILRPAVDDKGYLHIVLSKKSKTKKSKYKKIRVHRLVAQCFVPNPENKPEVNHEDGIKFNNYFENLKPSTRTENLQHAVKTGLKKSGVQNYNSKLTEEQVRKIRSSYIKGDSKFGTTGLAKEYGVSPSTIWDIVNFKRYKNVK